MTTALLGSIAGWANHPTAGIVLVYLSTTAIAARAFSEWLRPPGEIRRSFGWAVAVLVAYGFILPAWAQLHMMHGAAFPTLPWFHGAAVALNLLTPVGKALREMNGRGAHS